MYLLLIFGVGAGWKSLHQHLLFLSVVESSFSQQWHRRHTGNHMENIKQEPLV